MMLKHFGVSVNSCSGIDCLVEPAAEDSIAEEAPKKKKKKSKSNE